MSNPAEVTGQEGWLAKILTGQHLPIQVLKSAAGFYIGTADDDGPVSRESAEYWPTRQKAETALVRGDWTQRDNP